MRLCRADYHGAYFKVTRAGCPSLVGLEGFVAAETRNTFQLVAKDNKWETLRGSFLGTISKYAFLVGFGSFPRRAPPCPSRYPVSW